MSGTKNKKSPRGRKVLCLFNRVRAGSIERIQAGEESDNFYWGMLRLPHYGYPAEYLEIEQTFPKRWCEFMRRHFLNIHFVHTPLFGKILSYDIVFTSTAFGSLLLWAIYPFRKPKWVIFDFNFYGIIGNKRSVRQKILSWAFSRSSGIITLSNGNAEELKKTFPHLAKKIKFIPLGTDTNWFSPKPNIPEENTLFSPGRDPGRDYRTFFDAARDLPVAVKVTAKPEKLKKYEPLPGNVTAHNFTSKELITEYAKSKIVVLPLDIKNEYWNAMGCSTLVEAMAMGKAIIATRSASMESFITDGVNGVLVPKNDTEALKKAITDLLADDGKRKRLGEAARKFALEKCEAEKYAKNLAEYFDTI